MTARRTAVNTRRIVLKSKHKRENDAELWTEYETELLEKIYIMFIIARFKNYSLKTLSGFVGFNSNVVKMKLPEPSQFKFNIVKL